MAGEASRINGRKGGRPHGMETDQTKMKREIRLRLIERANQQANHLFETMFDLALGEYQEKETSEGVRRVYIRSPNTRMLCWLLDQTIGKAMQQIIAVPQPEPDHELTKEEKLLLRRALDYAANPMPEKLLSS
jgi:hypothetical protein